MSVRVRFAPSPTGYLHVGGARTALFNWLYARRHGGTFVLRIEDTDTERSSDAMVAAIVDNMRWLGLDWDEGPDVGGPHAPYFQAARSDRHRAVAHQLVASGHAYPCFCSPTDLQAKRAAAETAGGAWLYDRACRALTPDQIAQHRATGTPFAIRVLVPPGETTFDDQVHGRIRVDHAGIEDFIIVRSDGTPTYQLSVVADDIDMQITLVVRGDDHISNTPKQILLYRALDAPIPTFAHVPLILGPDKKRLSKRHGATSVGEYATAGYLPEAMVNFLALLGWSPGKGNEELFTRHELVDRFTLEGISGGNAVFNPDKLDWFNQQHIMRLSADELLSRSEPILRSEDLWDEAFAADRRAWILRVLELAKPRLKHLTDVAPLVRPFVSPSIARDHAAVSKHLADASLAPTLAAWRDDLRSIAPFDAPTLESALRQRAESAGIKAGPLIHATRVAVVGQAASPGLFEVLELIGRDTVVSRLDEAVTVVLSHGTVS